jgi:hypothetical protein
MVKLRGECRGVRAVEFGLVGRKSAEDYRHYPTDSCGKHKATKSLMSPGASTDNLLWERMVRR